MFPSKVFLSLAFIVLTTVDASLVSRDDMTTIGFTTVMNGRGANAIIEKDHARVRSMIRSTHLEKRNGKTFSLEDGGYYHAINVGIGQPPTKYKLAFDTGSANTWVGKNMSHPYRQTNTSVSTGNHMSVTYGSASFFGTEYNDTLVFFGDSNFNLKIHNQSIGAATLVTGTLIGGADGIIGFGPSGLSNGTVSNASQVPTPMDNLHSQRNIRDVFGVYFNPKKTGGDLTIGRTHHKAITEKVTWTPVTKDYPASQYWGIEASWTYDNTIISATRAGFVDSGTTLIRLSPNAFKRYMNKTGAVMDNNGFPRLTSSQFRDLKNLTLQVGKKSFDLIPEAQVWPPKRNNEINGVSGSYYLLVAGFGGLPESGSGDPASDPNLRFNFIVAHAFLQRYYSAYDAKNERVGLASTTDTYLGFD